MFLGCSPCCSKCVDYSLIPYTNLRLAGTFDFFHSGYSFWNSYTNSFYPPFPGFATSWTFDETVDLADVSSTFRQPYGSLISKTFNSGTRHKQVSQAGSTIETTLTLDIQALSIRHFENGLAVGRTFTEPGYGLFFRASYDQTFPGSVTIRRGIDGRGNYLEWFFYPCGYNNDKPDNAYLGINRSREFFPVDDSITLNNYALGDPIFQDSLRNSYSLTGTRRNQFLHMDGTTPLQLVSNQRGYVSYNESTIGDLAGSRSQSMNITVDTFAFETDSGTLVPVSDSWIDGPYEAT